MIAIQRRQARNAVKAQERIAEAQAELDALKPRIDELISAELFYNRISNPFEALRCFQNRRKLDERREVLEGIIMRGGRK